MITQYGLQVESPFDLKKAPTVAISIKKGETKTIDRAGTSGLLAIVVEEGGILNYTEQISLPGLYHTYVYMQGKGSTVNLVSRTSLTEGVADVSHQVIHEKDNTTSNINARGVLSGGAQVVYTSSISVRPNFKNVEGTQDAQFLLVSIQAKVKSIPGLSVYSDEVTCSHKVSVTPVDSKAMDFLASRGYCPKEAEQVLVVAFLD